jgi:hypothetical protein
MDATTLEKKLEGYQLIINRAIHQQKYPIAIAAAKLAVQINPVCDITRTLISVIHHRQGRYDLSSQNLTNIISTVDSDTLTNVQSLLNTYDIPCDIAYYECLQNVHSKISNEKIIKILFLLITIITIGVICFKFL